MSDGSVHQGRLGQDPKPWPVFSSPVLRVLALDDGFVCCSKSEVVSVRGGQTMRFRAADIVPTTLSVDGGFLFAGNFAGDLLAWDLTSGRALRRAGIHSGGVRAIHAAGGRLISAGRLRQVAVWRFSAEAGFERVEELELKRSGDRVTFLGPATDPREFLLGTVRGAVFRCEWR
ncbi:MAG: hypothetical protein JKY65_29435 [Planctomycetes bacterium]|nr:hypothetical protein [Planctomycetota bacterium]